MPMPVSRPWFPTDLASSLSADSPPSPHAAARTPHKHLAAVFALAAVLAASPALAQSADEPDPARVRVRIGPLSMNPTISLTNLGVDQNVFNDPPEKSPKSDFTATITPMTELWLRIGPTWLTGTIKEDIVWYQKYASERSASNAYGLGWRVPLSRMSFKTTLSYAKAKDRPGYEIDTRAARTQVAYGGTADIRALSKTLIGVGIDRRRIAFVEDTFYRGVSLHDEMTYTSTIMSATLRHELTPLTSLALLVSRGTDRFDFSPLRDSDATSAVGTVAFNRFAVIKGGASLGYQAFKPSDPSLPGYTGTTGSADLSYTLLGATRFGINAKRDVQYSYDVAQPYYVQTGFDGSIAQQIFGPFDVVGRLGSHTLAYRDRAGAAPAVSNRIDRIKTYGVGVGFHMGKELRLGFNLDHVKRESDLKDRRYDNLKLGTAITYGF